MKKVNNNDMLYSVEFRDVDGTIRYSLSHELGKATSELETVSNHQQVRYVRINTFTPEEEMDNVFGYDWENSYDRDEIIAELSNICYPDCLDMMLDYVNNNIRSNNN